MNCETENLGKFDHKSYNGIFLGYFETSKAFKIYNSRTLTMEESIHIKFNDSKSNKELLELNDSFVDLNLNDLHKVSKNSLTNGLERREMKNYLPKQQIIRDVQDKVRTKSNFKDQAQVALLSEMESKIVNEALVHNEGENFTKTFAQVARLEVIHILLSFVAYNHMKLH
ncbi:hypothetical protein CR513_28088, partial [Mucuna pruriens]